MKVPFTKLGELTFFFKITTTDRTYDTTTFTVNVMCSEIVIATLPQNLIYIVPNSSPSGLTSVLTIGSYVTAPSQTSAPSLCALTIELRDKGNSDNVFTTSASTFVREI